MKSKLIFPRTRILYIVVALLAFLIGSCEDEEELVPEAEIGPVTISFTATSPSVNNDTGNTAEITFTNTSTGNTPRYFWSFGETATPIATEVTDLADQTVVYELLEEAQSIDVTLEGRDNNGEILGTAVATISLPMAVTEEEEEVVLNCNPNIFTTPITFDNGEEFFAFGGTTFALVSNPDPSGANPEASMVGQITNSGAAFEGTGIDLSSPADFSEEDKRVRFLFFSTVEVPLNLQFVNGVNNERGVEAGATHTGSGWEEIVIDYVDAVTVFLSADDPGGEPMIPDGQYGQIVLFIDGPGTTTGDFFIDDVGICGENQNDGGNDDGGMDDDDDGGMDDMVQPVIAVPVAFENGEEFFTFGGTEFAIVQNSNQSGANPNDTMVGQITNSGAAFEGSGIEIPAPFADFTTDNKVVSFLFFSEVEVPLTLQFVNGVNGERGVETAATHTGSGWEEITLDYNNALTVFLSADDPGGEPMIPDGQYGQIVLFIDGPGTTAGDFFIDDIGAE